MEEGIEFQVIGTAIWSECEP